MAKSSKCASCNVSTSSKIVRRTVWTTRHVLRSVSRSILIGRDSIADEFLNSDIFDCSDKLDSYTVKSSAHATQTAHRAVPVPVGSVRVRFVEKITWSMKSVNLRPMIIKQSVSKDAMLVTLAVFNFVQER